MARRVGGAERAGRGGDGRTAAETVEPREAPLGRSARNVLQSLESASHGCYVSPRSSGSRTYRARIVGVTASRNCAIVPAPVTLLPSPGGPRACLDSRVFGGKARETRISSCLLTRLPDRCPHRARGSSCCRGPCAIAFFQRIRSAPRPVVNTVAIRVIALSECTLLSSARSCVECKTRTLEERGGDRETEKKADRKE